MSAHHQELVLDPWSWVGGDIRGSKASLPRSAFGQLCDLGQVT